MTDHSKSSNALIWTGRVLKILLVLFLAFDSLMKIIREPHAVKASAELGLHDSCLQPLGAYLIIATILYVISKTAATGGLLLTAYLGGAAAVTYVPAAPGHPWLFPVVFCILLWIAEYLQNPRVRGFLPFLK
jgi:hypothetical protein